MSAKSNEVPANQQQQVVEDKVFCENCLWGQQEAIKQKEVQKQPSTLKGTIASRVEQSLKESKTKGKSPYL